MPLGQELAFATETIRLVWSSLRMTPPQEQRPTKTPGKSSSTPSPASGSAPGENGKTAQGANAPPVDEALLLKLVRRQLTRDEAREAYRLVHTFPEWNEAHSRLLVEEFRSHDED